MSRWRELWCVLAGPRWIDGQPPTRTVYSMPGGGRAVFGTAPFAAAPAVGLRLCLRCGLASGREVAVAIQAMAPSTRPR